MKKIMKCGTALLLADTAGIRESDDPVEQLGVALLLAMDEAAPCDTLAVIAAHRDAPWFTGAPSLVFARTHDPAREALAEAIGVQDYVGLSSIAPEDCGRFVRFCIAHELRLTMLELGI